MGQYSSVVNELLEEDPQQRQEAAGDYRGVVDDLLSENVGGTFGEREAPPPGYPTPAPQFPEVPGGYQKYTNPTEPEASGMAMIKAGYVDDPITKVKIYAEARGIKLRDIARNYRFAKGGEIEFKTAAGKWQREVGENLSQQAKRMGLQTATNPAVIGGMAGSLAGPKGAIAGAMVGEGVRKTVGKFAYDEPQTAWGNTFDIALEGLLALGGETVAKVITGQTNKFLMRKSKALRFAGKEISEGLLTPADHAKALYIESLANKHGIKLQPHQLYDREGMTNIWMYLRKHPLTADKVQEFDRALETQTDAAIDGFIKEMGGYDQTPFQMGTDLKDVSVKAIKEAEDARQSTAKPYYEAAFDRTPTIDIKRLEAERAFNQQKIAKGAPKTGVDTKAMVRELGEVSSVPTMKQVGESEKSYVQRIAQDYKRITGKDAPTIQGEGTIGIDDLKTRNADIEKILAGAPPEGAYIPTKVFQVDVSDATTEIDRLLGETVPGDPSYTALSRIKKMIAAADGDARKLDRIKRSGIDNVIRKAKANNPTLMREMTLVKKQMTDAMDNQIADYSAARGIYGQFGMAPPIDEMRNSVIGELSKLEGHKELSTAVQRIFNVKNMPSADKMALARKTITAQDPELWNRAMGQYMRDIYFDLTVTEGGTIVNSAGKMNKLLFGNKARRESMAAAFGGENTAGYKNLKDLMTVLQRAAIGRGSQSMTAPFQQIEKELAGQMVTQAPSAFKHPWDFVVDKAFESWNDILLARRQGALIDALAKPDVIKKIKALKLLKPGSKKLIRGIADLAALTTPQAMSEGDADYEDMDDAELMKLLQIGP